MTGYTRSRFGDAWVDVNQNGCDTRDDILRRDLRHRTVRPGTHGCEITSGTLADPYTGTSIRYVRGHSRVDIDHVVALGDAWQMGAAHWATDERVAFANDRSSAYLHAYLDAQRERTHKSGVVIVGPADIWMSVLWRHHLRVAGQVGREGRAALRALAEKARTQTLQDAFGATAFGVGEVVMRREAGQSRLEWNFSVW